MIGVRGMKVRFKGVLFWLMPGDGHGGQPLAPLSHCDSKGFFKWEFLFRGDETFAHVFEDGTIKRYGKVIGHRKDLEKVGL